MSGPRFLIYTWREERHGAVVSIRRYSTQWLAGSSPSTRSTITQLGYRRELCEETARDCEGLWCDLCGPGLDTDGAAAPGHKITPQLMVTGLLAPGGLLPVWVRHSLSGVIPSISTDCGPGLASVSSLRHSVTDTVSGLAV